MLFLHDRFYQLNKTISMSLIYFIIFTWILLIDENLLIDTDNNCIVLFSLKKNNKKQMLSNK